MGSWGYGHSQRQCGGYAGQQMRSSCLELSFSQKKQDIIYSQERTGKGKRVKDACRFKEREECRNYIIAEWENKELGKCKRTSRQN